MKKNEIPTQGDHGKISLSLLILLFITSFITTSKGQNVYSIPLHKLIEESLEKDPRLQAAQTTSNLFLAEKSKAYQFGDIQLGYSHGEINAPVQDEQWDITVDLGNILGINKRINAAESKAMVQQQRINILRKQRILKIKDQWNKCILLLRKQKRLETRISEAEKALEIIELQLGLGEISGKSSAIQKQDISMLQLEATLVSAELEQALSLLSAYAFKNDPIKPVLEQWPDLPSPPDSVTLNEEWTLWWDAQEKATAKVFSATITQFNPTPRIGATIAQIEEMKGLFSWTLGLNMPLNPSGFKYEKEKYQLTKTRIKQEKRAQLWDQSKRLEQLLKSAQIQWQILENKAQIIENDFISPWITSFELGEIDFIQYRQALDAYYKQKDREDEFILKYYMTLSEIEYLAKT